MLEQLLIFRLIGGEEGSHPAKLRLFKNRPNMTFDDAAAPADQEFTLGRERMLF
jgi:hypothetical protein